MTSHLSRIRAHMTLETEALLSHARRARVLDHHGNRGSAAEHSIRTWLEARFAPDYSLSSGEIIDSFDTNRSLDSRQQDAIIHRNDPDANRFALPSGLRLVPIESVAAVVEVKLTLNKKEFEAADKAATETATLRYRLAPGSRTPGARAHTPSRKDPLGGELAANDERLGPRRPLFAVFAFGGTKRVETLAEWLRTAKTIQLLCCLDTGCVLRPYAPICSVAFRDDALAKFAECVAAAVNKHKNLWQSSLKFDPSGYYAGASSVTHWDQTGFEFPEDYTPSDDDLAGQRYLRNVRRRAAGKGGSRRAVAEARDAAFVESKRDTLLQLLDRAGITVENDDRARIRSCEDPGVLDRWTGNILYAKSVTEVLS